MGIYLDIRVASGEKVTRQELLDRLARSGLPVHPEGVDEYLLRAGTLTVASDAAIGQGILTHARLSWASTQADWEELLAVADAIGGQVWDDESDRPINAPDAQDSIDVWSRRGDAVQAMMGSTITHDDHAEFTQAMRDKLVCQLASIEGSRSEGGEQALSYSWQDVTRIKFVLKRMDEGQYGLCINCGVPISRGRLEVIPDTVFCADCARDRGLQ